MEVISTWIYLDSAEESSEYPQVGKASHLPEFQQVYWRCVAVFFAVSIKTNPARKHILFTNVAEANLPEIDGLDLREFLREKNVEIVTLPLHWQAPQGWHGRWRNQFYIFDILEFIENQYNTTDPDGAFVVLDSDCLVNQSLDNLFESIHREHLLVLPLGYPEEHNINGLTRWDMRELYTELDGKDPGMVPEYFGGEIFAADMSIIRQINSRAKSVWQIMLKRFEEGLPKFNEEAHFLSYCYHKIGNYGSLKGIIKRIWTSPRYNNVQPGDEKLPIWHLPAEKTGGIALIFRQIKNNDLSLHDLSGYVGIPKRRKYLNFRHFMKYTLLYKWLTNN